MGYGYTIQDATIHILGLEKDLRYFQGENFDDIDREMFNCTNPYRLDELGKKRKQAAFFALCSDIRVAKRLYECLKSDCTVNLKNRSVSLRTGPNEFDTVFNPLNVNDIDEVPFTKESYFKWFKTNGHGLLWPVWFDDIPEAKDFRAVTENENWIALDSSEKSENKEKNAPRHNEGLGIDLILDKDNRYCPELVCAIEVWLSFESKPYDGNALGKEIQRRAESWNTENHNVLTQNGISRIVSLINWKSNENKIRQK